jgi:hypothetical protein
VLYIGSGLKTTETYEVSGAGFSRTFEFQTFKAPEGTNGPYLDLRGFPQSVRPGQESPEPFQTTVLYLDSTGTTATLREASRLHKAEPEVPGAGEVTHPQATQGTLEFGLKAGTAPGVIQAKFTEEARAFYPSTDGEGGATETEMRLQGRVASRPAGGSVRNSVDRSAASNVRRNPLCPRQRIQDCRTPLWRKVERRSVVETSCSMNC